MVRDKLSKIQVELKAPKNQFNDFGKYKYRNCEDILEAVKQYLVDGVTLTLSDEMVQLGDRYYVKATATLSDMDDKIAVTAFAREAEDRKGMDDSQITGATSSYARKYALNGLLLIDDTKDSDTMKPEPQGIQPTPKPQEEPKKVTRVVDNLQKEEQPIVTPTQEPESPAESNLESEGGTQEVYQPTEDKPNTLTSGQFKFILDLWRNKGKHEAELKEEVVKLFGKELEQITKSEASQFIDQIKAL